MSIYLILMRTLHEHWTMPMKILIQGDVYYHYNEIIPTTGKLPVFDELIIFQIVFDTVENWSKYCSIFNENHDFLSSIFIQWFINQQNARLIQTIIFSESHLTHMGWEMIAVALGIISAWRWVNKNTSIFGF